MSNVIARADAARAANLGMALRAASFVESRTGMREASARFGAEASPELLQAWARAALCDGRSDCGALSALAFVHLRDACNARPLDWMQLGDFAQAFVVIGRRTGTVV